MEVNLKGEHERRKTSVAMSQCRFCGTIIASMDSATVQRHLNNCRFAPLGKISVEQMVIVHFPCPLVVLEKLALSPEEEQKLEISRAVQIGNGNSYATDNDNDFQPSSPQISATLPPRRQSSLRARQKLLQVASDLLVKEAIDRDDDAQMASGNKFDDEDYQLDFEGPGYEDLEWNKGDNNNGEDDKDDIDFIVKQSGSSKRGRQPKDVHKEEEVEEMTCPICDRMLHTRPEFQIHVQSHLKAENVELSQDLWNTWPSKGVTAGPKSKTQSKSCKYCMVLLHTHEDFLAHMEQFHKSRKGFQYICKLCSSPKTEAKIKPVDEDLSFETMKLLITHIQTKHPKDYYGEETPNKITQEKVKRKSSTQLGKGYYGLWCSSCPSRFDYEEPLKRHEYTVHGKGSIGRLIMTCPVCQRMFHSRLHFQCHIKNHENAEALEHTFDLWRSWPKNKSVRAFSCSCKFCVIPLKSHAQFLSHMKTDHKDRGRHPKYTCSYCPTTASSTSSEQPEPESFDSMKLLFRHMQTCHIFEYYGTQWKHAETKECTHCDKQINSAYFHEHMRRRHPNLENFDDAEKVKFETLKTGRMLNIAKPDNPYACPMSGCGARVKQLAQLKSHFILHLKNNPFVCTFPGCKVRCDAQCHLNRHMKLHLGKGIRCTKCGLVFSRKDHLHRHKCGESANILRRVRNYYDQQGNLRSHYAHLRLKRLLPGAQLKSDSNSKVNSEPGKNETEEADSPPQWSPGFSKKRTNINAIFATDPVFLQVCKENPGFRELMLVKSKWNPAKAKQFKCDQCVHSFNSEKRLKDHVTICHKPRPFQCNQCSKSFTKQVVLNMHVKIYHNVDNPMVDPYEKYIIPLENGRSACTDCGAELYNVTSLRRHWLLIHKTNVPALKGLKLNNNKKEKKGKISSTCSPKKSSSPEVNDKTKAKAGLKKKQNVARKRKRNQDIDWDSDMNEDEQEVEEKQTKGNISVVKVEEPELNIEEDVELGLYSNLSTKTEPGDFYGVETNAIIKEEHARSTFVKSEKDE